MEVGCVSAQIPVPSTVYGGKVVNVLLSMGEPSKATHPPDLTCLYIAQLGIARPVFIKAGVELRSLIRGTDPLESKAKVNILSPSPASTLPPTSLSFSFPLLFSDSPRRTALMNVPRSRAGDKVPYCRQRRAGQAE
jgi:hypothetical protein